MVVCSNCSSENESDAKFCKNCGNSLIIHSNIVEVQKHGENKVLDLQNRESRIKKAREIALKTLKTQSSSAAVEHGQISASPKETKVAVHIGEKII